MGRSIGINELADAVMGTLKEYADLAADEVKEAVKDAGQGGECSAVDPHPVDHAFHIDTGGACQSRVVSDSSAGLTVLRLQQPEGCQEQEEDRDE